MSPKESVLEKLKTKLIERSKYDFIHVHIRPHSVEDFYYKE